MATHLDMLTMWTRVFLIAPSYSNFWDKQSGLSEFHSLRDYLEIQKCGRVTDAQQHILACEDS